MRHGVMATFLVAVAILGLGSLVACSEEATLDDPEAALEDLGEVEDAEAAEDASANAGQTPTTTSSTKPRKKKAGRLVAVADVFDGDTIALADGRRVRLVQIDAPEVAGGECFADEATGALASLLPRGIRVRLEADPRLDREDRYGRLLRYVFKRRTNVNVALVRQGAASVWFYQGDRGRYADTLLAAARRARAERRGLWHACPGTRLDPYAAVETNSAQAAPSSAAGAAAGAGACDASYRGACIPSPPPDLDCAQVDGPFAVVGSDPHRFDGDRDGVGCER
jgi:micrococcal nuclease